MDLNLDRLNVKSKIALDENASFQSNLMKMDDKTYFPYNLIFNEFRF